MTQTIICPQCGSALDAGVRFCSECGYPIQPEYSVSAAPGQRGAIPATQKMDDYPDFTPPVSPIPGYDDGSGVYTADDYGSSAPQRSRTRPLLIGAGILIGVCCLAVIGVSFMAALFGDSSFSISLFSSPTPTATLTATPTNTPIPTNTPEPPTPTLPPAVLPTQPPVTGSQRLTDTEIFDDFSSTALEWSESEGENSRIGYEAGGYVIHIFTPDYLHLSRAPLPAMSHIEFNAQILEGAENGVFGVACYYQDIKNFHYAEFYVPTREYRLGRIEAGEWIDETDWAGYAFATDPIKYGVDCTAGAMAVYINDTLMIEIPVNQPQAPGEMWLFGMSWNDAAGGIKTFFDNVYGYRAVQ